MKDEAKMNYEHQTDQLRQPNGIGAPREATPLTTHHTTFRAANNPFGAPISWRAWKANPMHQRFNA
jgi:hypothetical protein